LHIPRDSQESFPAPQFESISSSTLSLYGPTLTSVYDWENQEIMKDREAWHTAIHGSGRESDRT